MKNHSQGVGKKNAYIVWIFSLVVSALSLNSYSQVKIELFAGGFIRPVVISNAGDSRLFIVEQAGKIIIVDSTGNIMEQPFLDIRDRIKSTGNEQGLLGLAFHPDYKSNGYFYVNYTNLTGNTVISRFVRSGSNPDSGVSDSEFTILGFSQPYSNHNGGDLKFGPDGYLYISTGDGGNRGDPGDRAQNPGELLGKMLRIDVDGGSPYAIPESNPFADSAQVRDEIWAMGLRNPWRFSFDRETGDLWIGDVGQGAREEIDFQPASSTGGENYGWHCFEGSLPYNSLDCPDSSTFVYPVYEYSHGPGGGCSVTGGFVYRIKTADASVINSESNPLIRIYPNPVHTHVRIEINAQEPSNPQIAIYNIFGELVHASQFTGNEAGINLEFLPPGIYFLELSSKTLKEYRKILKY